MSQDGLAREDAQAPLNLLIGAARRAARGLGRDLNELEQLQSSPESALRYAEAGRERARETLRDALLEARPSYGWIDDQEEHFGRDPRRIWTVEPLSGLSNFAAGRPGFAIAAAYADKGKLESAVVIDPANGEIYSARRNAGARRDQFRLRVAGPAGRSEGAAIAAPLPSGRSGKDGRTTLFEDALRIAGHGIGIRGTGSVALDCAWVAAGRLHGAWCYGTPDAAIRIGAFLVQEAGGRTSLAGRSAAEFDVSIAASGSVFDMLSEALRR